MRLRVNRVAAGLVLVFSGTMAGLVAMPGTAAAAEPIVIGSCATTVQGTPGQPVALSPAAVVDPVVNIVRAVPLLGPPLAGGLRSAFLALPPIPIGAVQLGTTTISGGTIATQVVAQLNKIPLLGPVLGLVVGTVQSTLTSLCGVVVTGANAVAAPIQDTTKSVADTSQKVTEGVTGALVPGANPGTPGTPGRPGTNPGTPGTGGNPTTPGAGGGTNQPGLPGSNQTVIGGLPQVGFPLYGGGFNFGRSPMADYSSIPFAKAGLFAPSPGIRYGGAVPGYTPQFGILGAGGPSDGVQQAGHAEALATVPGGNRIALPVLLAVLALSGVTAALVRTWVLRRTVA